MKTNRFARLQRRLQVIAACAAVTACAGAPMRPSDYHLGASDVAAAGARAERAGDIPAPVSSPLLPPPPHAGPRLETYSVVVSQVEISELLFAMARDAGINVDVHPDVRGKVTINAIDQTLPQILSRLSRQVSLRYEFEGSNLIVMPDQPFVRHYPIDYVNMTRDASANTSIATQISSTGGGALANSGGGQSNNNSTTQIVNRSTNLFWQTLVQNLRALVGESEPRGGAAASGSGAAAGKDAGGSGGAAPVTGASGTGASGAGASSGESTGGSSAETRASAVIASPETGMVSVRATSADHERVREYIDRVMNSARRQVLIEATIAEVQLSESFQQGVNWQKIRLDGTGWAFTQQPNGTDALSTGVAPGSGPGGITFPTTGASGGLAGGAQASGAANASMGVLRYLNSGSNGNIGFALSLLQSFGKVKVLSSPKISVLNNQTAVLKVVDNRVYFTIGVQVTPGTTTSAPLVTYTSTPNTVPVGFVMSVTPQIEKAGAVTMNVRPTISRIIGFVNDPNPALAQNNVVSRIPEIQTREIESILKVASGDIAVMGGLMQESIDDAQDAIPGAAQVPLFGQLFRYRNDNSRKSELVIFLRPIVIRDASLDGDYREFRKHLPGEDFFRKPDDLPVPRAWLKSDETRSEVVRTEGASASGADRSGSVVSVRADQ